VAVDALAVFVHKDNPIKGLTIPQVDAIMSTTRKCGFATDITTWGQAGLDGAWKDKPIQLYGRNSVSGTYGYFKDDALCKGDFKSNVNEQPGSASVVQSVTSSPNGIGYSGIGYKTSGVKAVAASRKRRRRLKKQRLKMRLSGKYPLTRYLYVYVNKKPNAPLAPLELEFVKMMLSQTGQKNVIKDGYIPLPAAVAEKSVRLCCKISRVCL
jgi:phosphate transport system substrate-binding protein